MIFEITLQSCDPPHFCNCSALCSSAIHAMSFTGLINWAARMTDCLNGVGSMCEHRRRSKLKCRVKHNTLSASTTHSHLIRACINALHFPTTIIYYSYNLLYYLRSDFWSVKMIFPHSGYLLNSLQR